MSWYSGPAVTSPLDQRSGLHTPVSREQEYSPIAAGDASFDASIDSLPDSSAFGDLRRSQTADHRGPESQQLSPNDMIAPASAVHSMSVNLLDNNHVGLNISLCDTREFPLTNVKDLFRQLF
jgi:hypothetical protein